MVHHAQQYAEPLSYAPLPAAMVSCDEAQIQRLLYESNRQPYYQEAREESKGKGRASFWWRFRHIFQNQSMRGKGMITTTERVWEAFHTPLHQFIRRRISDEATAEDLLQDVFLKIHQHVGTLKDVKRLESWIYQITRNAIIDYYRSTRSTMTLDTAGALDLPEELPADDVVTELLPCVRAMVQNLPVQDRQALVLTEYQGLTQKELGERLGLSFSGAKSRVQRAREKLKQQLLECCHFELDRRGHILDYQPRCQSCAEETCCAEEVEATRQKTSDAVHPFGGSPVSSYTGNREVRGALLMLTNEKEKRDEFSSPE